MIETKRGVKRSLTVSLLPNCYSVLLSKVQDRTRVSRFDRHLGPKYATRPVGIVRQINC